MTTTTTNDEEMEVSEEIEPGFEFSTNLENQKRGAEAKLTESVYLGREAVIKERLPKAYRHNILDVRLNKTRTKSELRGIMKAKELGVRTPAIFLVDGEKNLIVMEKIAGPTAKEWIEQQRLENDRESFQNSIKSLGKTLGRAIGALHGGGLVHGDLTTSNVVLKGADADFPVFIDFGLSSQGKVTPEEKGVDLYVLERAIASTHMESENMMIGVMEGYQEAGQKQATAVGKKLDEIRLRGRKRDMIG